MQIHAHIDLPEGGTGHRRDELRPLSYLRQSRATLTRDRGSRVKVASVTGHVARCVMARRTVARLVFGIERCSILCDYDARQNCMSKTSDKIAGVTSVLCFAWLLMPTCV